MFNPLKRTQAAEPVAEAAAKPVDHKRTQVEKEEATGAFLVEKGARGKSKSFSLPMGEETLIGRSDECQVVISDTDEKASRKHAKVMRKPGGTMIYDTGSVNGLFVNGQLVSSKKLQTGDLIRVGDTEFVYSEPGAVEVSAA